MARAGRAPFVACLGPMGAAWAAFLVVAVVLAGCTRGGDGGGPNATGKDCDLEPVLCEPDHYLARHHCIVNDVRPRIYAPDTPGPDAQADPWNQGDYWSYRMTVNGQARDTTLVYFEDIDFDSANKPQHYLVGVPSADEALEHALFSTNPMIGRIHRTLYSPHEAGVHADMFYFPLCDGSAWRSGFYERVFDVKAQRTAIALPGGVLDPTGFTMTGKAGDGSTLTHTYSPMAKWFTRIDLQRNDGLRVQMDLTGYGSGRTGTYHFLRAQADALVELAPLAPSRTVDRADGREGPYDGVAIAIDARRTAGDGKVEVHVRDPAGASMACVGVAGSGPAGATTCPAGPVRVKAPYRAGAWTVAVERALGPLDTTTKVEGEVRLASVYDRSGTV